MKVRYGKTDSRYLSKAWRRKRAKILELDHNECVICKAQGRHTPAIIVHHVRHADEYPELFLCDTYSDSDGTEHRQLISVCKWCHENVCHPEKAAHRAAYRNPLTTEKW